MRNAKLARWAVYLVAAGALGTGLLVVGSAVGGAIVPAGTGVVFADDAEVQAAVSTPASEPSNSDYLWA